MARYLFDGLPDEVYFITVSQTKLHDTPIDKRTKGFEDSESYKAGRISTATYGPYAIKGRARQEYNKHTKSWSQSDDYWDSRDTEREYTRAEVKFLVAKTTWKHVDA